jgi:hypothetical protein
MNSRVLETRYYDNGKAYAKLHKDRSKVQDDFNADKCDRYTEEIGKGGDWDSLEEWIEYGLIIDLDDIVPLVLDLDSGKCVEITPYI